MTGDLYAPCPECGSKDTILVNDIQKLLVSHEPPYKCNNCGSRFYSTQFFYQISEQTPEEAEG